MRRIVKSGGTPIACHFGSRHFFGLGLTCTGLGYRDLQVDIETGEIVLGFTIAYPGRRAGVAVPQLYVRDRQATVARPVRELEAFARVRHAAGASARVRLTVPVDMLCLTDAGGLRVVEPGWFDLMVGPSSANTLLRGVAQVGGAAPRTLPLQSRMESRSETAPP